MSVLGGLRMRLGDDEAPGHAQMHNPLRAFSIRNFPDRALGLWALAARVRKLDHNMLAHAMHAADVRAFQRPDYLCRR